MKLLNITAGILIILSLLTSCNNSLDKAEIPPAGNIAKTLMYYYIYQPTGSDNKNPDDKKPDQTPPKDYDSNYKYPNYNPDDEPNDITDENKDKDKDKKKKYSYPRYNPSADNPPQYYLLIPHKNNNPPKKGFNKPLFNNR